MGLNPNAVPSELGQKPIAKKTLFKRPTKHPASYGDLTRRLHQENCNLAPKERRRFKCKAPTLEEVTPFEARIQTPKRWILNVKIPNDNCNARIEYKASIDAETIANLPSERRPREQDFAR